MTSSAVFSVNSKTPSSRRASCFCSEPASWLCSTSMPDLLRRVQPVVLAGALDAEEAQDAVGGAVEDPDRQRHHPGERHQRCRDPAAHFFGVEEGERLGHQLAQDDVQDGDDGERDRDGQRRGSRSWPWWAGASWNAALDDVGQGRFAHPAQAQGGQGDPELGGRDVPVERLNRAAGKPSFAVAGPAHLVQPRAARAHQGELRRDEERVGEHEEQDGEQSGRDRLVGFHPGNCNHVSEGPRVDDPPSRRSAARGAPALPAATQRLRTRRPGRRSPASSSASPPAVTARCGPAPSSSTGSTWRPRAWEVPRSRMGCGARIACPLPLRAGARAGGGTGSPPITSASAIPASLSPSADGTILGMKVTPLDRVGLYVPGGKASYPSSVIMNAVPAVVAGVREIVAVTPPGGFLTDAVLAACELAGVTRLFRIGGAQAVAALAYGTATVPRVDKIVGPGKPLGRGGEAPGRGTGGYRFDRGTDRAAGDGRRFGRCGARRLPTSSPRRSTTRTLRPGASPPRRHWPTRCPPALETALATRAARGHRARITRAERGSDTGADHRGRHRRGQPAGPRASRDPDAGSRGGRGRHPPRRRDLPRAAHARAGR